MQYFTFQIHVGHFPHIYYLVILEGRKQYFLWTNESEVLYFTALFQKSKEPVNNLEVRGGGVPHEITYWILLSFLRQSSYVSQVGLKIVIFLSQC